MDDSGRPASRQASKRVTKKEEPEATSSLELRARRAAKQNAERGLLGGRAVGPAPPNVTSVREHTIYEDTPKGYPNMRARYAPAPDHARATL